MTLDELVLQDPKGTDLFKLNYKQAVRLSSLEAPRCAKPRSISVELPVSQDRTASHTPEPSTLANTTKARDSEFVTIFVTNQLKLSISQLI